MSNTRWLGYTIMSFAGAALATAVFHLPTGAGISAAIGGMCAAAVVDGLNQRKQRRA